MFSLRDEPDFQLFELFLLEVMDPDFTSMEELLLVVGCFLGDGDSLLWFSLRDSQDDIPDVLQLKESLTLVVDLDDDVVERPSEFQEFVL